MSGREDDRFTIADCTCDRNAEHRTLGEGSSTHHPASGLAQELRPLAPVLLAPAITAHDGPSNTARSSSQLRIHQPTERVASVPSTMTTSPTHPLSSTDAPSPMSSTGGYDINPPLTSPTRSTIRPLPSIPRSASTTRSIESTSHASGSHILSPTFVRTPIDEDPSAMGNGLLSPGSAGAQLGYRTSSVSRFSGFSGNTGVSAFGAERRVQEEKDFAAPAVEPTARSRWYQNLWPSSWPCRCFLITVLLETIINLVIEGNILWRFNEEIDTSDPGEYNFERNRRLPIYLIIYGLAHLWQVVLAFVAVKTKNTIQVNAVTVFNFALLAYAIMQIYELRQILGGDLEDGLTDLDTTDSLLTLPLNALTAVVIAVLATGSLVLLGLAYLIRREFGWQRYRFLGADLQIRKYFFRFQVYECLCYFGAFFCAGFGIQFIWLVLSKTDVEYIITWVAFPLLVLLLVLGRWAARYENVYAMGVFMVGLVVACAYFIFKLVRIWERQKTTYYTLTKSLTIFDALSLISLTSCFAYGIIVWRDFGKGLKEAVLSRRKEESVHSFAGIWNPGTKIEEEPRREGAEPAQRRISID